MTTTEKRQCTATSKQTHERCKRSPSRGALVCHYHGSKSPQARHKAAERLAQEEAAAKLSRMNIPAVTDPIRALQEYAGRVLAREQVIADAVASLTEWRYTAPAGEQRRAELAMLETAMAESRQTLGMLARLHLDERVVQIREREADIFQAVMAATFARLLPAERILDAEAVFTEELSRALVAGTPGRTA